MSVERQKANGRIWCLFRQWRQIFCVQHPIRFERYDVAPRKGMRNLRHLILHGSSEAATLTATHSFRSST